jgi:hypothetical protein
MFKPREHGMPMHGTRGVSQYIKTWRNYSSRADTREADLSKPGGIYEKTG